MLHPSNRELSQFEWRSRIDMTKTKRSNGSRSVTVSISHSPCFACPALQRSRSWPFRPDAGETIPIAFSIILRLTQDRAHFLKTVSSLRAPSTVKTKHCSDYL